MADLQSDCVTPGFWFKYIQSVFLFMWNSLRDGIISINFNTSLEEIQPTFEGDAFEENTIHGRTAFNLNKCKRNLDHNIRSLNLNMHCPGKLKILIICPNLRMLLTFFISLASLFFPYTSFQLSLVLGRSVNRPTYLSRWHWSLLGFVSAQQGRGVQSWPWNISNHSSRVLQSSSVKAY